MTHHYLKVPDAVSMTRNPICIRVATDYGPFVRQTMALYRVRGYSTEKLYEEMRYSSPDPSLSHIFTNAAPTSFDFAEVIDAELSAEVPPAPGGDYAVPNAAGQFLHFSAEEATDDVLVATITGASAASPAGFTFDIGKWYRLEAEYLPEYAEATNELTDLSGNSAAIFEPSKTVMAWGRLHFPMRAEYAFDTIRTYINGWEIKVYEMPPSRVFTALKGGWDWRRFPSRASTLPTGTQLLTAMPLQRHFRLGQMAWLAFLAPGNSTYYRQHTIHYDDGTSSSPSTASLGFIYEHAVMAVDISDAALGYSLASPGRRIVRISVRIYQLGGMDHTIELMPGYADAPFMREFHYTNAAGGSDWIIASGKGQASEEYGSAEYRRYAPAGYGVQDGRQYGTLKARPRQSFTASIGYRSREERDAAKGILEAERAFIREGALLVPITVEGGSFPDPPDGDHRHTFSFSYSYAFDKLGL
jgi:hypothetical protein